MKKITTTKFLIFLFFLNCTFVELFTGWATIESFKIARETLTFAPDLTPLVTLIGTVVSEALGYGVYCFKAKAENSAGGLTYELAMLQAKEEKSNIEEDTEEL